MAIPFEGTLTEQQYTAAYRYALGAQLHTSRRRLVLILIIPLLALLLLTRLPDTTLAYGLTMLLIVLPLLLFLFIGYGYFMGGRRAWAQQSPSLRTYTRGEVTGEGVRWNSELLEGHYRWDSFTHYYERRDLLMLYTGALSMLPLPRAFLPAMGIGKRRGCWCGRISRSNKPYTA